MKRMTLNRAKAVATETLQEYVAKHRIPESVAARLSVGISRDDKDWIVEVLLHPHPSREMSQGLKTDLRGPRPRLVLSIRVTGETGTASLTEIEPLS